MAGGGGKPGRVRADCPPFLPETSLDPSGRNAFRNPTRVIGLGTFDVTESVPHGANPVTGSNPAMMK